ncbi:MAG: phosphocholine cytidylyltransferase family protein [Shimia sp.]
MRQTPVEPAKGLILAAGRGSRMGEMTRERPKGLVPFLGRPLIEWQLRAMRAAGITEIAVVTGYRADLIEPYGDRAFHNPAWAETQMVSSLMTADAWLSAGPVVVSYSDLFYGAAAVRCLLDVPLDLALTYDPDWLTQWAGRFDDPLDDAETFQLGPALAPNGVRRLRAIGRTPSSITEVEGQYMGLLRFTPAGWADLRSHWSALDPASQARLSMTEILSGMLIEDHVIGAVPFTGPWGEIDSAQDLAWHSSRSDLQEL